MTKMSKQHGEINVACQLSHFRNQSQQDSSAEKDQRAIVQDHSNVQRNAPDKELIAGMLTPATEKKFPTAYQQPDCGQSDCEKELLWQCGRGARYEAADNAVPQSASPFEEGWDQY